ncbi:MAG: hypothetical protein F6J87_07945 [Spirulina sp. SIO3F2]|nr:hypothetical protein [Spirulina sp. SIO3F2]
MPTTLTNEQIFKLVCMEVIESLGVRRFPPVCVLYEMTNPGFIDWCETLVFVKDDGKLDEGEQSLLDWMKQNAGNWDLVRELMPVAERLEAKLTS